MGAIFCLHEKQLKLEKERKPSFLVNYNVRAILQKTKSKILQEDKDHFFENQEWFKDLLLANGVSFLDIEKFLENYKHYKIDQMELDQHWKKEDIEYLNNGNPVIQEQGNCLVPDWKFLIRKGVPMKYMRTVILFLFKRNCCNNEFEYKTVVDSVFKGHIPSIIKNCPSFSEKHIDDLLLVHYLTPEGLYALKKILVILKESCYFLEYSPMVPTILSLLLLFMTEAEAFCCIKSMLEISKKYLSRNNEEEENLREMRWYFTLEPKQFFQLCNTFFQGVQAKSGEFEKILTHFTKNGFQYMKLFEDWTICLYLSHLPFATALKVFLSYLNEGVKIYFRVSYGICYLLKDEILKCSEKTELEELIKQQTTNLTIVSAHQLLRISYALTLKKVEKSFLNLEIKTRQNLKKCKTFFRPRFNENSDIITDDKIETLWEWLPRTIKMNDAFLLFSTKKDGFSLNNLYNTCLPYQDKPMLLIMRNDKQWIYGAFCDQNLSLSHEKDSYFRGTNSTFVFVLSPVEKKFPSLGINSDYMRCDHDSFSFGGGGDGPAFSIDSDLNKGHTYKSETYENFPFNGCYDDSKFQCLDLELFVVD